MRLPALSSLALVAALLALAACDEKSAEKASSGKNTFEKDANDLIERFSHSLKGSLQAGMMLDGPVGAINLCSTQAPALADQFEDRSLKIRRIGTRTRNPDNTPSKEDQEVLKRLSKKNPTFSKEGRYYKAIFTRPLCLSCHGPKDSLSSDVLAALKDKYPEDKATGYTEGELRGAFVVEAK